MTLPELINLSETRSFFTPSQVSEVLCCDPYSINVQAKKDIRSLGFPASMVGNRVKIPAVPFLRFMGVNV